MPHSDICRTCGLHHEDGEACEGPRGYRWDKIEKDEHGCWLCPMCPPDENIFSWSSPCMIRGLHVQWETWMTVADDPDIYDAHEYENAIWKVECINDHVLLTSRDFGIGDEEEPPLKFRPDMLLKTKTDQAFFEWTHD